jgi:hypothetical protein
MTVAPEIEMTIVLVKVVVRWPPVISGPIVLKSFVEPNADDTGKLKSSLERLCINMMNVLMLAIRTPSVRSEAFCTVSSKESFARLAKCLLGWCRQPRGRNVLWRLRTIQGNRRQARRILSIGHTGDHAYRGKQASLGSIVVLVRWWSTGSKT